MKRLLSIILTGTAIMSLTVPIRAQEDMTADKVKKLLYTSSIANSANKDELMSYTYTKLNSEDISSDRKLDELGDISRSFKSFSIAAPGENTTYYDYSEGDMLEYFTESEENSGYEEYFIESPDDPSSYINVCVYEGYGEYAETSYPFEFGILADSINTAGLDDVSDIRMCSTFFYIKAENGEYAVSMHDVTNDRRENGETIDEWTVYPLADYLEFITDKAIDEINAEKTMKEKISQVEIPAEFIFDGDEPRETAYFAEYTFTENPFTDTDGITAKAAALLYDMGVTKGCGGGIYAPDADLTVEQAGMMLERLMKNGAYYTDGYDPAGKLSAVEAANMLLRLTGSWIITVDADSIYRLAGWILQGIESFDVTAPVSRGDFAVMLCNSLDQPMNTYVTDLSSGYGIFSTVMMSDITLIDYVNGGKLNGVYVTSQEEQDEFENKFFTWFYNACGDILYEYYGDDSEFVIEEMQKYGWEKPE